MENAGAAAVPSTAARNWWASLGHCWVSMTMMPSGVSIAPAVESPPAPIQACTPSATVTRCASLFSSVMRGDLGARSPRAARSLRLDAGNLDHVGPFVDIFGDEPGELVRRVRRHRHGAEIGEPLLAV